MKSKILTSLLLAFCFLLAAQEQRLTIQVYNKQNRFPIPGANIVLQEITSGRTSEYITNDTGAALVVIQADKKYRLDVAKDNPGASVAFMGFSNILTPADIQKSKVFIVELERIKRNEQGLLPLVTLTKNSAALNELQLEGLNRAVQMLSQFPTLRIEIGLHADCREQEPLLKEREKVFADFFNSKGLTKRVSIKNYGAAKPLNNCDCSNNLIKCDEAKYDENRRAEFKITSF